MGSQIYSFNFDKWVPCIGSGIVSDIDGNIYNTVQIGNQCWMKENLKTTTYSNNLSIQKVGDSNNWINLTTGAYVWYNNDSTFKDKYGALYNWHAVNDVNGICPTGWHVPTDEEWTALTDFVGGVSSPYGNELKSCRQINSPLGGSCNTTNHPRWIEYNSHYGTDESGFSGLPGGSRSFIGPFADIGIVGCWWSSTESSATFGFNRYLSCGSGDVYRGSGSKQFGMSVRCLRD